MKKKILFIIGALMLVTLAGCSPEKNEQGSSSVTSQEEVKQEEKAERKAVFEDNAFKELPLKYWSKCKQQGTVEKFSYQTKNYAGEKEVYQKETRVYLPYGYDEQDETKKYPVLYLMHGAGDDETWYFGDGLFSTFLCNVLDHMIKDGVLEPCIVCTPTYNNKYNQKDAIDFFPEELREDLIPAFETKYKTYYDEKQENSLELTRYQRCFGGFSMGALTTWRVFDTCLAQIGNYLPVSGAVWFLNNQSDSVSYLEESIARQGFTSGDFIIYSGCGGKDDFASKDVKQLRKQVQDNNGDLIYCDNFAQGNFYAAVWKDGGHDVNTVCNMVYNGLPKFFNKTEGTTK